MIIANPISIIRFIYHIPSLIRLIIRLLRDPRIPTYLKLIPYLGFCYFIFPMDLLKDFPLVYLGFLDDIFVMYYCLKFFLNRCPKAIVEEHIREIAGGSGTGKGSSAPTT